MPFKSHAIKDAFIQGIKDAEELGVESLLILGPNMAPNCALGHGGRAVGVTLEQLLCDERGGQPESTPRYPYIAHATGLLHEELVHIFNRNDRARLEERKEVVLEYVQQIPVE